MITFKIGDEVYVTDMPGRPKGIITKTKSDLAEVNIPGVGSGSWLCPNKILEPVGAERNKFIRLKKMIEDIKEI